MERNCSLIIFRKESSFSPAETQLGALWKGPGDGAGVGGDAGAEGITLAGNAGRTDRDILFCVVDRDREGTASFSSDRGCIFSDVGSGISEDEATECLFSFLGESDSSKTVSTGGGRALGDKGCCEDMSSS